MSATERALQALQALAQFEMIEIAADVAQATSIRAQAQEHVTVSLWHLDSATRGLRAALTPAQSGKINPALVQELRRQCQVERVCLCERQEELLRAREREQQARTVLAQARSRENAIERAVQVETRREQLRQEVAQVVQADDLWLQRQRMRELS